MTSESLPRVAQAEYLSEALRRSGALNDGRVRDVVVENSKATILSRIMRLRLSYDGVAFGAPSSIILKTGLPERAHAKWNSGRHEVAFYRKRAAARHAGVLPNYIEAVGEEETDGYHFLPEDHPDTHSIPQN